MSGVLAVVSLQGRQLPEALARAQLQAITHRGAGDPRLWLDRGVALGQAHRATTPEAEREHLPLHDASGRYHLVWDGRLDNRDQLARLLGFDGAQARAATDADYVLAAYTRWGDDSATRLLGDWAVVIWDGEARRLFCAKDSVGLRTLYYAAAGGLLAVGSEPLQLLQPQWIAPEPHVEHVRRLLGGAFQEPNSSCYAGLHELAGGQALVAEGGEPRLHSFWREPRVTDRGYSRPEEYVEAFVSTFDEATRARLRSNRPVGAFFSGGLDSSYIVAVASQHAPLTAISSFAAGTRWDEREHQRLVVDHLGVGYHAVDISDCWGLSSNDLPDASFDAAYTLPQGALQRRQAAAAADRGVGVVLGGEGGDEWLSGRADFVVDALVRRRWRAAVRLAGAASPDDARALTTRARVLSRARAVLAAGCDATRTGAFAAEPVRVVRGARGWLAGDHPAAPRLAARDGAPPRVASHAVAMGPVRLARAVGLPAERPGVASSLLRPPGHRAARFHARLGEAPQRPDEGRPARRRVPGVAAADT